MMRLNSIRTRTVLVLLSIRILAVLVLGGMWSYQTMKNDTSIENLRDSRLIIRLYVDRFTHAIISESRSSIKYSTGFREGQ